jgi:hypothetical protein
LELALGEAPIEIEEGAVAGAAGATGTGGFAALEETLDQGGMEEVRGEGKGTEQIGFALAKGQGGFGVEREYPTHIYE